MKTAILFTRSLLGFSSLCMILISSCVEEEYPIWQLREISGNNQMAIKNYKLPKPLKVFVVDENGNHLKNAEVEWRLSDGSGVLDAQSFTDDYGYATALWTTGRDVDATVSATLKCKSNIYIGQNEVVFRLKNPDLKITKVEIEYTGNEIGVIEADKSDRYTGYLYFKSDVKLNPYDLQLMIKSISCDGIKSESCNSFTYNKLKECLMFRYCSNEIAADYNDIYIQLSIMNSELVSNTISLKLGKPMFQIANPCVKVSSDCESGNRAVSSFYVTMEYFSNFDVHPFIVNGELTYRRKGDKEWNRLDFPMAAENCKLVGTCLNPLGSNNNLEIKLKALLYDVRTSNQYESNEAVVQKIE
jgi:hypothetical protein